MPGVLPLCFVLMPFGTKADASGRAVDFDALYRDVYQPAIRAADMEPLRADEEHDGGIIHKPMFERLVLCPFALADLTLANANVFYELGVRHAVRPFSTILTYDSGGQRLPFDVAPLRALPYAVDTGRVLDPDRFEALITERLRDARSNTPDSPLYQLLEGFTGPEIARLKTDVFREQVRYSEEVKHRLAAARELGLDDVRAVHADLQPIHDREAGIVIDLLLSYRDVKGYDDMVTLVSEMPPPVARSVLVQEQTAFALNRLGRSEEAQRILESVIDEHGPSSETLGLLGRVFKDRWEHARANGRGLEAAAHLRRAIAAYRHGFESDWRDAFPGINALTLLDAQEPNQAEFRQLLPVVRYAVQRRLDGGGADYWDHASMLELRVLSEDGDGAEREAGECLVRSPASWYLETTVRNLVILRDARLGTERSTAVVDRALEALRHPQK